MNGYAVGILISILRYFVVGSYAGRKVCHLDDCFAAGRRAATPLIAGGALIASGRAIRRHRSAS